MAVNGDWTVVHLNPAILPNTPDGRQVPVEVSGWLATNHPQAPRGVYFVTDAYRADEPRGPFSVFPAGTWKTLYLYGFSFEISLQAKRSTNTPDGRYYNLFVGGTDADGTGGRLVRVFVPKDYAAAIAHQPPPAPAAKAAPTPHHPAAVGPRHKV